MGQGYQMNDLTVFDLEQHPAADGAQVATMNLERQRIAHVCRWCPA